MKKLRKKVSKDSRLEIRIKSLIDFLCDLNITSLYHHFLGYMDQQLTDIDLLLLNVCELHLEIGETIQSEISREIETTVKTKLYPWIFLLAIYTAT